MLDSYNLASTHFHNQSEEHQNHHQSNNNSGLLRFRSAPSSLFSDYAQNPSEKFSEFPEFFEKKPQILGNTENGYSGHQLPPQYPKQQQHGGVSVSVGVSTSMEMDHQSTRAAVVGGGGVGGVGVGGGGLNLNRQSSSPAGFFNQLNPQNGYTIMRGIGNYRVGNGTNGESSPRSSRLGMTHLPRIPEIANENIKEASPAGFAFPSWDDSGSDGVHLSENGGLSGRPVLSHHLSLPKTSAEMATVEKLLHFQDTIPCKVRAKRGCATHPRSIAERVRRNRISERMRKLQDLVPNMDKQTNTADMLDLAVDYIKNLQSQYKVLNDNRAKCKCSHQ